jgi:hypothetical protein
VAVRSVTVIARNYLPHARVLAGSLREHHPGARPLVVVVDEPDVATRPGEPFERLSPLELVDGAELHRRALLYDAQGLISSLRPRALAHVLGAGEEAVVQLDADMLVLAPIDDLWALAPGHVVLSPHAITPLSGGPDGWHEEEFLLAGAFNGGLLGVGRGAEAFLTWLTERADRDCVRDPSRGLVYTQTWLDLVPALFPHLVLRDPSINAMVHNLGGRDVDGVRLFHFTGFDARRPGHLSRYYEDAVVGERPLLAALTRHYAVLLREHGWPAQGRYRWDRLPGGAPVDAVVRGLYRAALLAAERAGAEEPPNPFTRGQARAFDVWLRGPWGDAPAPGLSRYLAGLYEARPDLRAAFPQVRRGDASAYRRWADHQATTPDVGGEHIHPVLARVENRTLTRPHAAAPRRLAAARPRSGPGRAAG